MSTDEPDHAFASIRRRAWLILGVFALGAGVLAIQGAHEWVSRMMRAAEPLIASHPTLGPVFFVALATASAVLAFFSSAVIVPAAVYVWGKAATMGLLWLGWWLGGALTYAMGRGLRTPLQLLSRTPALEKYLPNLTPGTESVDHSAAAAGAAFGKCLAIYAACFGYGFACMRRHSRLPNCLTPSAR